VRVILQITQRDRLAELDGLVGVAAPVNPGVDAVPEADVVRQLVQLAVDGQPSFR
jgi:hypothetical protein